MKRMLSLLCAAALAAALTISLTAPRRGALRPGELGDPLADLRHGHPLYILRGYAGIQGLQL